jgi:hypothetical protein
MDVRQVIVGAYHNSASEWDTMRWEHGMKMRDQGCKGWVVTDVNGEVWQINIRSLLGG